AAGDPAELTLADLAAAVGVTARSLQRGFRETLGVSPMAYVRGARLDRVHAELQAAQGPAAVTGVATRWGFFHLGRFAAQYRERFGELPSDTARR
ncbi:helix-turn-helix transcriptional regulator, partial [Pseudonocardia ailaonensis]|uniref:helix-turn-helix transcriptional regulator n=1 Tax=Pseudonocardia ailaonensis TaxID=367279 RepID=UPI0031CF121A